MITHYNLTTLIASILPWPFAVNHAANASAIEIRDLQHPSSVILPYTKLTSPEVAAKYAATELLNYRLLIDAWYGRYPIIWS